MRARLRITVEDEVLSLADVARFPEYASAALPQLLDFLRDPETCDEVAHGLRAVVPLPVEYLEPVLELAEHAPDLAVRRAAAWVLGRCGAGSPRAVALLERLLAELDADSRHVAWWALLELEPDHRAASDCLLADWRREGLRGTLAFHALPRLGDRIWAGLEADVIEGRTLAWFDLRARQENPQRVCQIARRGLGLSADASADVTEALTHHRSAGLARRVFARVAASSPGDVSARIIQVILARAEALVPALQVSAFDELGDLAMGLAVAGWPVESTRVEALLRAAVAAAVTQYERFEEQSSALIERLVVGLRKNPVAHSAPLETALTAWVREPRAGRAVCDWLTSHGVERRPDWSTYWSGPSHETDPCGAVKPITETTLGHVQAQLPVAYEQFSTSREIPPEEGIGRVEDCVAWLRCELLGPKAGPDGLPAAYPLALSYLLGDLIVRGQGWHWAERAPDALEGFAASLSQRTPKRTLVVVSESGLLAVDVRAVIEQSLCLAVSVSDLYATIARPGAAPGGAAGRPVFLERTFEPATFTLAGAPRVLR